MKYKSLPLIALAIISCAFMPNPGDDQHKLPKILTEEKNYTNVGNIGFNITNFGVIGNGFANRGQANYTPSCEYPIGSGIEHLFAGGLWVGGFMKDSPNSNPNPPVPFVTTGAVDRASLSRGGGFEFTTDLNSHIIQRSSLQESKFFNSDAISHQDFLADYNDTNLVSQDGSSITDHNPLGISVHQESYAWNFPFADAFVIMNFTIKNISNKYLDSVYVGIYSDAIVRNIKKTDDQSASFFSHSSLGYDDSLKISYVYDSDSPEIGFTDSYIGFLYLGSTPKIDSLFLRSNSQGGFDTLTSTSYVAWQWNGTGGQTEFNAPQTDIQRYDKMQGYFQYPLRYQDGFASILHNPANRSELITHGYFKNIAPDSSINVVYAIVCGKKFGNDPTALDTRTQRNYLYNNADWALRAYFGNDRNRNGILDPGEDLGDGKLHHYVLPAPPVAPIVKVITDNNKATIYWDKRAEASVDPISGKKDFAGYQVYRTQSGFDLTGIQNIQGSLVLLAEYDSAGAAGFNNGFKSVELADSIMFPNDTVKYWYKYEVPNLLNGWQYLFAITAFDKGDSTVPRLYSNPLYNLKRIIPGTTPSNDDNLKPGVYPNPYYGNAYWDGSSERLRKIYFNNLPSDCEITIYTLAGDVVKRMQHNQNSNGTNIRWFEQYAGDNKQQLSGGEHAWDLVTDNDQAIATGLYLFTVKNNSNGKIKTGKFLIIK